MYKELFTLALLSIKRKKRTTILMCLILSIAISFSVIMLSITESMNRTNQEYRFENYGTWKKAVFNLREWEAKVLQMKYKDHSVGVSCQYGTTSDNTGVGTLNEDLVKLGRIQFQEGRLPQTFDEVAMEADVLRVLDCEAKVGDKIRVPIKIAVEFPGSNPPRFGVLVKEEYTLCGILKEYSDIWRIYSEWQVLTGVVLTKERADQILETVRETHPSGKVYEPKYQIFLEEGEETGAVENIYAYHSPEEKNHLFYVCIIFVTTILAILCIYLLQLQNQIRQYTLFRNLGITKRQLRILLFYETMILFLPSFILGIVCGSIGIKVFLKMWLESNVPKIYVSIPVYLIVGMLLLLGCSIFICRYILFEYILCWYRVRKQRLRRIQKRLLCVAFASVMGSVMIVSLSQYQQASARKVILEQRPSYKITGKKAEYATPHDRIITQDIVEQIEQIPGVKKVNAWSEEPVDSPEYSQGFTHAEIFTTKEAADLSTDAVVTKLAYQHMFLIKNNREIHDAQMQEAIQRMFQAIISGGSICIIAWMLFWNIGMLSNEAERKSYGVIQAIGMSKRQIKCKIFKDSLILGTIAGVNSLIISALFHYFYDLPIKGQVLMWAIWVIGVISITWYYIKCLVLKGSLMEMIREDV